jgi:hypothetical protein
MRITKDKLFSIIKEEVEKMLEVDAMFEEEGRLPGSEECDKIKDEDERAKCLDFHSHLGSDEEGQRDYDEFLRTHRP